MTLESILEKYQDKYSYSDDFAFEANEDNDNIVLEVLRMPTYAREMGNGTAIIEELIEYSNITGKPICVSPAASKDDIRKYEIDMARYKKFWDKFNFKLNRGKDQLKTVSHDMYMEAPEPYTNEMKEVYKIISNSIDITKIKTFDFLDFYKDLKKEISKHEDKREAMDKINIVELMAEYIIKDFEVDNYRANEFEETTALERFGTLKQFSKLGEGSDRIVYKINEKYSLKVCKNTRGIIQNENEFTFDKYQSENEKLIPKNYEQGKDYIIIETCKPYRVLEKEDKKRISDYLKPFKKFNQYDWDRHEPALQEAFEEYGEMENYHAYELVSNAQDMLYGDFTSPRNWGIDSDNNLIMLDGGTLGNTKFLREAQNTIFRREAETKNEFKSMIGNLWKNAQVAQVTSKVNSKK